MLSRWTRARSPATAVSTTLVLTGRYVRVAVVFLFGFPEDENKKATMFVKALSTHGKTHALLQRSTALISGLNRIISDPCNSYDGHSL